MLSAVLLPIATLLLGQLLGYLFAIRKEKHRVAAEKRIEHVSAFMADAYANLGYIPHDGQPVEDDTRIAHFSVLGSRAGFFVSDRAAEAIEGLTSTYAKAVLHVVRMEELVDSAKVPRDMWREYNSELERVRAILRSEVGL
jgi:hypothetical protein